jgi:hypothetical protein
MDIEQLQKLYNASDSNIKWAKHCLERMQERGINIKEVESCLQTGEIIENCPDDFPYPSCPIFRYTNFLLSFPLLTHKCLNVSLYLCQRKALFACDPGQILVFILSARRAVACGYFLPYRAVRRVHGLFVSF